MSSYLVIPEIILIMIIVEVQQIIRSMYLPVNVHGGQVPRISHIMQILMTIL